MHQTPTLAIDNGWYRDITQWAQHTHWLHEPMKAYTIGGIALICLLALIAWLRGRARGDRLAMAAVAWLVLGTIISVAVTYIIKDIVKEQRPCSALPHVFLVEKCPGLTDYSFPSNHTTIAFAIAAGVLLVSRKLGWIALILAVIEGFSRVYNGQHYPHDVIAGAVVSLVIVLGGWLLVRGLMVRLINLMAKTPLKILLGRPGARRAV